MVELETMLRGALVLTAVCTYMARVPFGAAIKSTRMQINSYASNLYASGSYNFRKNQHEKKALRDSCVQQSQYDSAAKN